MKYLILNIIFLTLLFSACSQKYPCDLGENYKLDYDGNSYFHLLDTNNTVIINSHITKYNFDSVFIVIEQKPIELILGGTYNNLKMNLTQEKKLINESPLRYYWMINKKDACIYGPFKKDEYLEKREELKIPKELVLKEE